MPLFTQYLTVQPGSAPWSGSTAPGRSSSSPAGTRSARRASYQVLDLREQLFTLAPQEVLTADGVTVKVTAALRWRIGDPVIYTETVADPLSRVYLAVQIALREGLAPLETDAVLRTARQSVTESATAAALEAGRAVGIEVLEVVVKDVILPADLRAAYGARGHRRGSVPRPSSRPRGPRRPHCGRWPTAPSCSTTTRRSRSCG